MDRKKSRVTNQTNIEESFIIIQYLGLGVFVKRRVNQRQLQKIIMHKRTFKALLAHTERDNLY